MSEPEIEQKDPSRLAQNSKLATLQKDSAQKPRAPRRLFVKFILALLFLIACAGAVLYATFIFRDKDERINLAATLMESKFRNIQAYGDTVRNLFNAPQSEALQTSNLSEQSKHVRAEEIEASNTTSQNLPSTVAVQKENSTSSDALTRLGEKIEVVTELARKALKTAEENARQGHEDVKSTTSIQEFSPTELIAALEGRIDALDDELKVLRQKLDAPKNENRAAAEMTRQSDGDGGSAATVVIAFALEKELEAGHPYIDEVTTLTKLGIDPATVSALTPSAETGAPTGAKLHELFVPIAKKIIDHQAHPTDLTGHLLHGASKLVRVRPIGQSELDTLEGKLDHIESALSHDQFEKSLSVFLSLPEEAQAEAGEVANMLTQRAQAAKAAHDLLHNAIAALGGGKK